MITTINPYTSKEIKKYTPFTEEEIDEAIDKAHHTHLEWRETSFEHRSQLVLKLAQVLRNNKQQYANMITAEMGKPISQALAEIEKCAWLCEYYANNAQEQLATEVIDTDHTKSYVTYEPIGVVLAVMPWNYPFWQVMRFIVPALMAGNTGVLKHASSVMGSAQLIEESIKEAGFPAGAFINLIIPSDLVEHALKNKHIKAATVTGSKPAGSAVASTAGKLIKKTVLELGGSNALVVFKDVNIEEAVESCVSARYSNTGQSCIAGKRLILHEKVKDEFLEKLVRQVKELKSGDPMDKDTFIGVMAREDLAEELEDLMNQSIKHGAEILIGGKREKTYFEPTIVDKVTADMPLFKEETFGPLLAVTTFSNNEEAIELVNKSKFGLGVSLYGTDTDYLESIVPQFKDGAVFINHKVASHPKLPFGGTGISGYGRELGKYGIREFCNIKTVVVS